MTDYSWSKKYQLPQVCFKTQKNTTRPSTYQTKLRETIDVSSFTYKDLAPTATKNKTSFTESLRHTTSNNTSLTDLLEGSLRSYKTSNRSHHDYYDKFSSQTNQNTTERKYKPYQSSVNSTWRNAKFRSMKDIKIGQSNQPKYFERRDHLWNSQRFISSSPLQDKIKSAQLIETPSNFSKKQSPYCTTPSSQGKEDFDSLSTQLGSPINSNDSFSNMKLLRKKSLQVRMPPALNDFVVIKHLGQGRFGAVSMAIHKASGLLVALKKVKKQVIKAHKLQNQFIMQMKMQLFFNHPNILKLYGYFDDSENIYLVLQFMEQGTLFSKLKKLKHFSEKQAARKMQDILHAIRYMHELEIAHRDIKPENIVMSNDVCKLCDFGWAAVCEDRRTTLCGTIDYAPPEVLQGKQYGISIDLWCLGVLCYELLVGKAPFYHISRKQTMQKIIKADTTDLNLPRQLSKQSIDFINKMLIKDPEERMHAEDALEHMFIVKNIDKENQKLRGKSK